MVKKKRLTKKELDFLKNLIEEKRNDLLSDLGYIRETSTQSTIKEASGDHSSYSFHMADQGTDSMEREKAFLFASRNEQYLDRLNKALERIRNSTYGICTTCNELISIERLKAVPTATTCVSCKTKNQKT